MLCGLSVCSAAQGNSFVPDLPNTWINGLEYMGTTSNTITFPTVGTGGAWTCPGLAPFANYQAGSMSSLQQAINDAENCRANAPTHPGTTIVIPAGTTFTAAAGLVLPQSPADLISYTNFIILTSSNPAPLGQTVCSHGLAAQDNLPVSTRPALRNLGCNGQSLSYQLGGVTYPIASGAFAYANGAPGNTADFNDIAQHLYTIEYTNIDNIALSSTWDINNIGSHHYAILNGEFRPQAGITTTNNITMSGRSGVAGYIAQQSQIPIHMHFAYDYIHGDMSDAEIVNGVIITPPIGKNNPSDALNLQCLYCSVSYCYMDKLFKSGAENHGISLVYGREIKMVHNWIEGSSINFFCGGAGPVMTINGFMPCDNTETRGNRFTYSRSWNLAADQSIHPNSFFQTTGGTGSGAVILLTSGQNGYILQAKVAPTLGGSGYTVNDVLTLQQNLSSTGTTGTVLVNAVDASGAVTGITVAAGTGYSVATNLPVTGSGTGATVDITQVSPTGKILAVALNNPGTGYSTSTPILTITQGSASGGTIRISGTGTGGAITTLNGVVSGPGYYRTNFYKKNQYEHKAGRWVVIDGNVFENNDYTGQQGNITSFKTSNSSSGLGQNYWIALHDVTSTNNILRESCGGAMLSLRSIRSDNGATGGGIAQPTQRILYRNNLMYDIDALNPGCVGYGMGQGYGLYVALGNTATVWTANATEDSTGTIATYQLVAAGTGSTCTAMPCAGMNQSGFNIGDNVLVMNCNGGTNPAGFSMSGTTLGPGAIAGTLIDGLTVVIPWITTPNSTATGCQLYNSQGLPNYLRIDHTSEFMNKTTTNQMGFMTNAVTPLPWVLARNVTWANGISVNSSMGFAANPLGEGTRTQQRSYDVTTTSGYTGTFSMHDIILTGRDTGVVCPGHVAGVPNGIDICYSAYKDDYTIVSPPSLTLYGKPTPYCPTNDPTVGDCVGIIGIMNKPNYDTPLPDWHDYRLCHTGDAACNGLASKYAAGGPLQGSDGKDLGPDLSQIEVAQVRNQYPAPGSFPDSPVSGVPLPASITGVGTIQGVGSIRPQ